MRPSATVTHVDGFQIPKLLAPSGVGVPTDGTGPRTEPVIKRTVLESRLTRFSIAFVHLSRGLYRCSRLHEPCPINSPSSSSFCYASWLSPSLGSLNICFRATIPGGNNHDRRVRTTGEHRPMLVSFLPFTRKIPLMFSLVTSSLFIIPLPRYPCMRRKTHAVSLSERGRHQMRDSRHP